MKILDSLMIRFGLKKQPTKVVIPLSEKSAEELKSEFNAVKAKIEDIQRELNPLLSHFVKVNLEVVKKLSPVQNGDIIQVRRKKGIDFSYIVAKVLYDQEATHPVKDFVLICRTFTSSGTSFKIGNSEIIIGGKSSTADTADITEIFVERNIYKNAKE